MLRAVHVNWTIHGAVANAENCARDPELDVTFYNSGLNQPSLGFAPVPCLEGTFTVDKLPINFGKVGLRSNGMTVDSTSGYIDRNTVALVLLY